MTGQNASRFPIAILLSGTGRTLENLIERIDQDSLPLDIRFVLSSHSKVRGLEVAKSAGLEAIELLPSEAETAEEYSERIFSRCRSAGVQLVVLAGFIRLLYVPSDFEMRVVNIHPSLIPAFCGKGFYGSRVHKAVIESGVKQSGCTVHFVDNEYDHGPILLQQTVPVLSDDTPQSLADRVFAAECEAYPVALQAIAEGRIQVDGTRIRVESRKC